MYHCAQEGNFLSHFINKLGFQRTFVMFALSWMFSGKNKAKMHTLSKPKSNVSKCSRRKLVVSFPVLVRCIGDCGVSLKTWSNLFFEVKDVCIVELEVKG